MKLHEHAEARIAPLGIFHTSSDPGLDKGISNLDFLENPWRDMCASTSYFYDRKWYDTMAFELTCEYVYS